jgi:hypothetical protein
VESLAGLLDTLVKDVPLIGHIRFTDAVSFERLDYFRHVRSVVRALELEGAKYSIGSRTDARKKNG